MEKPIQEKTSLLNKIKYFFTRIWRCISRKFKKKIKKDVNFFKIEEIEKNISIQKYKIEESNYISIPEKMYNFILNNKKVNIICGNKKISAKCIPNYKNKIEISRKIKNQLPIIMNDQYNVKFINDNIYIGPLIAHYVSKYSMRKILRGKPSFRVKEACIANETAHSCLYFFSSDGIKNNSDVIQGIIYDSKKKEWIEKEFPYPDIINIRKNTNEKENNFIDMLVKNGVMKFNAVNYFDKLDMYDSLSRHSEIREYLPYTTKFSAEKLRKSIQLFDSVYIKDRFGSNGRNIVKVEKIENDRIKVSSFSSGELESFETYNNDDLLKKIKRFVNVDKTIIQEGINILKIKDRNIDMRATAQKVNGRIEIIKCPVRIGKPNYPVTSTRTGSSTYKFDKIFQGKLNLTKKESDDLKSKICEVLEKFYKIIEIEYGKFGEIGMDVALDEDFNVFFIECNAKPGKDTLYKTYKREVYKKAFLNPFNYIKQLWLSKILSNT